jgi:hypothetical protein
MNRAWRVSLLCCLLAAHTAQARSVRPPDDSHRDPPAESTPDPISDQPPQDDAAPSAGDAAPAPPPLQFAEATSEEAESLNRLASSSAWTSRALAAMRLERYDCEASAGRLVSMTRDSSWRVRAYCYAVLARRGVSLRPEDLAAERDERVLRAILRGRYQVADDLVDRRIAAAEKSSRPLEAMLALEILAALDRPDDKPIRERMDELLRRIILRMDRTEAGVLSRRLAAITGGSDSARDYRWREWYRKSSRKPGYESASLVPSEPKGARLLPANSIAALDSAAFVAFERYLAAVAERPMDLAILIDCTASMWRELADAQSSADDLVEFLNSVTAGVRVAIVGYRDRHDSWKTRAWDFTSNIDEARSRLWSLSAEGGGDGPEAVHNALKTAFTRFDWSIDRPPPAKQPIRACVLVGDAPPHPGEGTLCVELARRAFAHGIKTYGIIALDAERNLREEGDATPAEDPTKRRPGEEPKDGDGANDDKGGDKGGDKGDGKGGNKGGDKGDGEGGNKGGDKGDGKGGDKGGDKGDGKGDGKATPVAPPRPPPPSLQRRTSNTWFPEIAEAGGGRAELLKRDGSLVAQIAELTVADKHRAEFSEFFAAFQALCR